MRLKNVLTVAAVAAGLLIAGASFADAPPYGTEQFEEWFDANGQLVGYVHWTCDGRRETWGSRSGRLEVSQRACPEP
ncbi:hypothetical protein J5226_18070 [Lysobacter sp. K5869]|uniref:DUF6289 family protein n=1 Tax=Lysobacter sp. K5869 TaxID=2820808 RepID=UPI001C05FE5F|nr:DUF6289 family protein [Lysobacter sp. K5869]QWP75506.1 hypothetical protein J5226_18070 [Lysobacter sp. K5869]